MKQGLMGNVVLYQTCLPLLPGLNVDPRAAEGAVGVGLGAVQDLLDLLVSGFLGFHSNLQQKLAHFILFFLPGNPLVFFMNSPPER